LVTFYEEDNVVLFLYTTYYNTKEHSDLLERKANVVFREIYQINMILTLFGLVFGHWSVSLRNRYFFFVTIYEDDIFAAPSNTSLHSFNHIEHSLALC
jgi:hypothetical protein